MPILTRFIFIFLAAFCLTPWASPPLALFMGIAAAFTIKNPYPNQSRSISKKLLQFSVVGLGFGMNLHSSLEAGKEGMVFTIISVVGTMCLGILLGKLLKVEFNTAYLVSSGTAICGGSAIAAIAPVTGAKSHQISVAMGTVFILNAIALFIFPPIGHFFGLTQEQFGLWAAIAIHDTSSVVGAAANYGEKALEIATLVKLTRALWIIPLVLISSLFFKAESKKKYVPWFILFFVLAMIANTFIPMFAESGFSSFMSQLARRGLTLTLFLIGAGLSRAMLKEVGFHPMFLGVALWAFIGTGSLFFILKF